MPDPVHLVLLLALGALIGALGGLFGIGGGLLAIPVLGLLFHLDQQHAQGTAMAMVAPNVLAGVWHYSKRGGLDRRTAVVMALAAVPFTYLGAYVAVHVSGTLLRRAFGAFLAALALWFLARRVSTPRMQLPWGWAGAVGVIGGSVSGIFSVGGAVVAVPLLSTFFGYAQASAQGTALGLVVPGLAVSMVTYAHAGDVEWAIGIPLAIGGVLFVRYGVLLAHRLPDRTLRAAFCAFLAASSAALFLAR